MKFPWEKLPTRPEPGLVTVVVESPGGTRNKYKHDAASGLFRLVRFLPDDAAFPYDYGYVPGTRSGDGDPLDVLLVATRPTFVGCVVYARPVGVLRATKRGTQNDRLLAVPMIDKAFANAHDLGDLALETRDRITRFFADTLPVGKHDVGALEGAEAAQQLIDATSQRARRDGRKQAPERSRAATKAAKKAERRPR